MSSEERDKITTGSIFANALGTSVRHVGPQEAGKKVLACPGCGAPRSEADPSLTCRYCGSELTEDTGG